jgi:hypothetical protein
VAAVAELVRLRGVRHVIFWAEDPTALVASHFTSAFFGALALPRTTVIEAYTLALFSVQVGRSRGGFGGVVRGWGCVRACCAAVGSRF